MVDKYFLVQVKRTNDVIEKPSATKLINNVAFCNVIILRAVVILQKTQKKN